MNRTTFVVAVLVLVTACYVEMVPVTFVNQCKGDAHLWCSMKNNTIGGSDGILLHSQTRFHWQTQADFGSLTDFKCRVIMDDKKANWTSWAGGYRLHPMWTLKEEAIVSRLHDVVPWLPAQQ